MIAAVYEMNNECRIRPESARITKKYKNYDNLYKYGILPLLVGPYKLYTVQIFDDYVNGTLVSEKIY